MHTSNHDVQALKRPAPQNGSYENVARTMSSQEIADLVGSRHDKVKQSIERLAERGVIQLPPMGVVKNHLGQSVSVFQVSKRDSFIVVAQLSPEFTAALVDRWQELEQQVAQPRELSTLEILQLALESEKARVLLTIQVEQQATKIHQMENLFQEGMTAPQFCKKLNGVNVMQVGGALEGRSWLYNESKTGVRWRVASYARDRYMTEHAHEVTPHGKDAFFTYTPVLLKKGAIRLYELYLNNELPMKKTWDGLFTHDKELRAE